MKLAELQAQVTASLLAIIESGVSPWQSGKRNEYPQNGITGRLFTGFNPFILMAAAHDKGYTSNLWLTFNQIRKAGGRIVGSKTERQAGAYILVPNSFDANRKLDTDEVRMITMYKGSARWNVNQTDLQLSPPVAASDELTMRGNLQALRDGGVNVTETGGTSCYMPGDDRVMITRMGLWTDVSHHYSTCCHEHVHWTGHSSRLHRPHLVRDKLAYAFEELVAEIGAAMQCARRNVTYSLDNHASYVASWAECLAGDKTAIFRAASLATKAVAFIDSKAKPETETD